MKIYTKTGDDGTTGLYGGQRTSKASLRILAIGDVDELNACLGLARCEVKDPQCSTQLMEIQNRLFDLGAVLAQPTGASRAGILPGDIAGLEDSMDLISEDLPELRAFILPGGSRSAAILHLARTVCRRAERSLTHLNLTEAVDQATLMYLNRLSDWLFMAARWCNHVDGHPETEWRPRSSQPSSATHLS